MCEQRVRIRKAAVFWFFLVCIGADCAVAAEPMSMGFVEAGRSVLGVYWAAFGGFVVADLDGDGIDDVAFTGTSGSTSLFVVGQLANKAIGFKQVVAVSADNSPVRVVGGKVGGIQHIFVVSADGTVADYSGWPLSQVASFSVPPPNAAVAGPLYGNAGADALVTLTADHVYAYALDSGEQLWSYEFTGGVALALAQLDADPALEVIISADASRVIDGATLATDWQYPGAFGYDLATGHLAGDETTQFLGAVGNGFTVFGGNPWMPLWSGGADTNGVAALATADLDNNHHDVVLAGDAQWGIVNAYDSATHQLRFTINYSYWGVNAIAAPDIDGDGTREVVFESAHSYAQPSVEVVDSTTGEYKWSFESQAGLFSPIAFGDVDGDGKLDLVVANFSSLSYADPSRIEVFDAVTGALEWQSPVPSLSGYDPYYITVRKIVLRPHANDAAMDIILAGQTSYDGKVVWVDGATHAVKFQVYTYGVGGPLVDRNIMDAALVDYDNDGTPDLVVASAGNLGTGDAVLHVFSGLDGHTLWTSPKTILRYPSIANVLITGSPADDSGQLVAALTDRLIGYGIKDPSSTWSLLAAADGAVYVPNGADGPEFAVFLQSGAVTFYSATDRNYLRAFALPAPLNALMSLDGTHRNLLAASSDALTYLDGAQGMLLARTPVLGNNLGYGNQLAASEFAPSAWRVAAGNNFGVYQYLLEMTNDRVFENSFDSN